MGLLDSFQRRRGAAGRNPGEKEADSSSPGRGRVPADRGLERLLDEVSAPLLVERPVERGSDVSGTIEVRAGRAIVTDPVGRGMFPTIAPGPGVAVFVNGKAIQGTTVVTSAFAIEIFAPLRKATCEMAVRISESQLEAFLTRRCTRGQEFRINDAAPTPRLTVTATVVSETDPPPVDVDDVLKLLAGHGVTYGIDALAVRQVAGHGGTVTVARGDPPVPGEDARIEYCFPEDTFAVRPSDDHDLRVDLLERLEIASVVEGTVLARKSPARPGTAGLTVTGEPLPAPGVRDVALMIGDGVQLLEDGLTAVATRQGKPILKNGVLSVLPVFVLEGDVDPTTGNITFNGHLVVKGNVAAGLKVRATGEIRILGDAEQATIVAGGNVDVRGSLIGCTVRAGGLDALSSSMVLRLEELALELELLVKSVYEVKANPSFRKVGADLENDGPLVRLLLDKKFRTIPQAVGALLDAGAYPSGGELFEFLHTCARRYRGLGPVEIRSIVEVATDAQTLKRLVEECKANIHAPAHLVAGYAQNCTLEASGRVRVIGEGCYNCVIRAGQEVRVEGRTGVFRGGSITSGGDVNVKWLGAPAGSPTKVNFLPGKRVTAETVEADVILKAGRQVVSVGEEGRWMEACLDRNGRLQVSKLKPVAGGDTSTVPRPEDPSAGRSVL